MISFRSSIALGLWLAACASAPQPPARTSPLSPQAEEPPIAPVATSLRSDPLAAPLPAAGDAHAGHHHSAVSAPKGEAQAQSETYVCPMHPDVKQSTPGKCPRCGMKLVPAPKPGPAPEPHVHEHHAD